MFKIIEGDLEIVNIVMKNIWITGQCYIFWKMERKPI